MWQPCIIKNLEVQENLQNAIKQHQIKKAPQQNFKNRLKLKKWFFFVIITIVKKTPAKYLKVTFFVPDSLHWDGFQKIKWCLRTNIFKSSKILQRVFLMLNVKN